LILGSHLCNWTKTCIELRGNAQKITSCVTQESGGPHPKIKHTYEAKKHTSNQSQADTWIHGPINRRKPPCTHLVTHLAMSRMKGGARGGLGASAEPSLAPLGPIFHVSLALDLPTLVVGDSPEYSPSELPLGDYIRRRAPLNINHQDHQHLLLKM
jgi:hypothetical protein